MNHGLKSLAQELPKHGRYGDSIVAHINPQEAALLKSLGGSGTINPVTGLPEFWGGLGALNPFNKGSAAGKAVASIPGVSQAQNLATQVFQPVEKAVVQPVSNALVNVDKAVGKAIPGGWGTVGMIAGSAMGLPTWAMTGLGALNGSGVMHPGRGFNMQGALMGGAMAYGMAELGEYARAADGGTVPLSGAETPPASLPVSEVPVGDFPGSVSDPTAGMAQAYTPPPPPSVTSQLLSGNVGDAVSQMGTNISEGISSLGTKAGNAYDALTNPETYKTAVNAAEQNVENTFGGIKNLISGPSTANAAANAAVKAGTVMAPGQAALMTGYAGMSLAAIDEQEKYLKDQLAAGNIAQAEYNQAMDSINKQRDYAASVVAEHPFSTEPSRDTSIGETFYNRADTNDNLYERANRNLYAIGGSVDDENGMDEARGLNQGNMTNGFMGGGMPSYAMGGMPSYDFALRGLSQPAFNEGAVGGMQQFAAGGRFLSGGGDGMSDSIHANIEGNQEARLADGEFVIPADVVSHLGNGSSKAGAKQLYAMMDRARVSRTGKKSQGKQINPRKVMPA